MRGRVGRTRGFVLLDVMVAIVLLGILLGVLATGAQSACRVAVGLRDRAAVNDQLGRFESRSLDLGRGDKTGCMGFGKGAHNLRRHAVGVPGDGGGLVRWLALG
jgi:type II secretory pathway pseudopilin PulG